MWLSSIKEEKEKIILERDRINTELNELNQIKENLQKEINVLKEEKEKIDNNIKNKQKFFINHELLAIDTMSGIQFEEYFTMLLNKIGYSAKVTKATSDEGADIIAEKDAIKYVFQCKNYASSVGNKAVQQVYTAQGIYKCDKAIVITNNYYTKQAIKEAEILSITLWDRDILEKILYQVYEFDIQNIEEKQFSNYKKTLDEYNDIYEEETDPFLMEAIEAAMEMGQVSASFIQRRFKVGYARAGKIIDQMEAIGIIGGYEGSKPRQVLVSKEQWQELKNI